MKHHCQIFYRGPTENSLVAVSQLNVEANDNNTNAEYITLFIVVSILPHNRLF